MSVENLKEYARRCAAEPELRVKAKEFGFRNIDEHIRHAGSLDLDWTPSDLVAFRKEVIDAEGDLEDLDEEELEQIAGGVITAVAAVVVGAVVAVATAAVVTSAVTGGVAATGDGGW